MKKKKRRGFVFPFVVVDLMICLHLLLFFSSSFFFFTHCVRTPIFFETNKQKKKVPFFPSSFSHDCSGLRSSDYTPSSPIMKREEGERERNELSVLAAFFFSVLKELGVSTWCL